MRSESTVREESLRTQIALGWITNLLILCMMFVFMITDSALANNNFEALQIDPGTDGLRMLVYMIPYYALMPIYVYGVSGLRLRLFRWVAVVTAALAWLFFILHHMSHWVAGQRPDFNSHVLDLTLHLVGIWVLFRSIQWARIRVAESAIEKTLPIRGVVAEES